MRGRESRGRRERKSRATAGERGGGDISRANGEQRKTVEQSRADDCGAESGGRPWSRVADGWGGLARSSRAGKSRPRWTTGASRGVSRADGEGLAWSRAVQGSSRALAPAPDLR